jgi:glyoxylase-like metal-dependent hydrolase (beta-lactamase superfamily II)
MRRVSEKGWVAPGLFTTGPFPVPLYVATGDAPVIFDAGVSVAAAEYAEALDTALGETGYEAKNFLTHVHWDHCGAAAFLRSRFPGLRTGVGAEGAKFLSHERYALQVRRLNGPVPEPMPYRPFVPELVLRDGHSYRVSRDLSVEVLETPGHTRESVSFHLPEIGAIVTGDTLGIPTPAGPISCEFLADYDAYYRSLERLDRLRPRVICLGHVYVLTDEDAQDFIGEALRQTDRFRVRLETLLVRWRGDRDAVFRELKTADYDPIVGGWQPPAAYALNLRAQIAAIAARMARARMDPCNPPGPASGDAKEDG